MGSRSLLTNRSPIRHPFSGRPAIGDQSGSPQLLQMLRRVGDGEPNTLGQRVHAAFALPKMFENLEAVRTPEGAGDCGEF